VAAGAAGALAMLGLQYVMSRRSDCETDLPLIIQSPNVARLPAFSSCGVVGDTVYVSGTLGTVPPTPEMKFALISGGVRAETAQTLSNIRDILTACFHELHQKRLQSTASNNTTSLPNNFDPMQQVVKCNVYLKATDAKAFATMNEEYVKFFSRITPPARMTCGGVWLALNAEVEIECVAKVPSFCLPVSSRL